MRQALIELHYLPSLEYLCVVSRFDHVVLEKHEHFVKQTYRNRCQILTAQGALTLTVPLIHQQSKQPVRDVAIDFSQKWQNNHWRSIETAYRNAPFYDFYQSELEGIIYDQHASLFNLNHKLLSFCLRSMGLHVTLSETVAYEVTPLLSVEDMRSIIVAKKPYLERNFYKPIPYYQVFGSGFVANMSALDLLFCMGPQSLEIIKASAQVE